MSDTPRFRLAGTVLATRDARGLADVYERLLGWSPVQDEDGWVVLDPGGDSSAISFHEDVEYVPPVWPSTRGRQEIMSHLDIGTNELDAAIAHARACGARDADFQPGRASHARSRRPPVLPVPLGKGVSRLGLRHGDAGLSEGSNRSRSERPSETLTP
jgi:catechol 2,3-dioxygenase-like lactoylglutathione lyase family enzyme